MRRRPQRLETVEPDTDLLITERDDEGPELPALEGDVLPAGQDTDEERARQAMAVLDGMGESLDRLFSQYEMHRAPVEWRWLEDLRQFQGQYDPADLDEIKKAGGSQLFVNITKPKCHTFSARFQEILLPTDGKNWGFEATPVPQLARAMKNVAQAIDPATGQPMVATDGQPVTNQQFAKAIKQVAKERCEAMESEVDDQLTESGYNAIARQAVDQMAQLGTGIAKGPVLTDKRLASWTVVKAPGPGGTSLTLYKREETPDPKPGVAFVDCWNLYPDMSASTPKGWEGVFEQFLVNKRELRKIAKENGFDEGQVARLLESSPMPLNNIQWLAEMRALNGLTNFADERYRLLQYHGELDPEEFEAAGIDVSQFGPLSEIYGVVWLCNGIVLKVTLSPLDSGEHPYSLAYCEKDPHGPFGYGIPRLMRSEQRAANASYRMLHDNAGLSVGDQIVMNHRKVLPADGDRRLTPRKMWYVTGDDVKVGDVFGTFKIDAHQTELLNLFNLNVRLADDATMTPLIAQGDQAPHITKTAKGMTILFNAANVVLRRSVKNWDDFFTVPLLTRFYEWNMQFNERDDIKGDFRVVAKGSSVLLEKEQEAEQAQVALQFGLNPAVTPHIKIHELVEAVFKSWRLDTVVRDEEDYDAERKRLADETDKGLRLVEEQKLQRQQQIREAALGRPGEGKPGAPGDPMAERKMALEEDRLTHEMHAHADEMELRAADFALKNNLSLRDARAQIAALKIKEDGANQRQNAEARIKERQGSGL